jgi:ferredoxin
MPMVVFKPEEISVEVAAGATILDAAKTAGYALPFSCGKGRCSTDLVRVVSGEENLSPPDPDEEETLAILAEPRGRLACVARVLRGEVSVIKLSCEKP